MRVSSKGVLAGLACAFWAIVNTSPASGQNAVEPYFLVMVDTSGSMGATTANSCGQPATRLNAAKCVLAKLIDGFGDVEFGLGRFDMLCGNTSAPVEVVYSAYCGSSTASNPANRDPNLGQMLVPIQPENEATLLSYLDFAEVYADATTLSCPNAEPIEILVNDRNYGPTALAALLNNARRYYEGTDPLFPGSPIASDPYAGCRPNYVILLTDGIETCARQSDVEAAATALRSTTVPGVGVVDIKTYVVAFGVTAGNANVEAIALAGGTDAPGANRAFYAQNEQALALAFSQIVQSSLLTEVCDNADNDCDNNIDEGFVKYCNLPMGVTMPTLCADPGDLCNVPGPSVDDNCQNGTADEVKNACGTCGPPPTEICNLSDDDCDNFIDEGNVCAGCQPEAEICDGKDNDCDGRFDESITRPCGTDEGTCVAGTQTCIEQVSQQPTGTWGPCNDVGPQPETCDNMDNNCDGLIDGFAQPCYTFGSGCTGNAMTGYTCMGVCQGGSQLCTAGGFGMCQGQIGPGTDICNGVDDDCDGPIDENNPGGGGQCGSSCGVGTLECQNGNLECVGGTGGATEVCNGFDDDCDGMIDEMLPPPIGTACDEMGTLCMPGTLMCVGGVEQCVGGVAPAPETCDCDDNDCDGTTDESVPNPICPAGATCLAGPYCLCARPCSDGEFPCPSGFKCVDPNMDNNRFCVPDPCANVPCDPLGNNGDPTVCVDGACVDLCDTVTCGAPLVCRPSDGACVQDNCNGFPDRCADNELCLDGTCVSDPCDGVNCNTNQFCRDGNCFDSCAGVECPVGESCMGGNCTADPCGGVFCPANQACNPADGECVPSMCGGVSCPSGQACNPLNGDCEEDPCFGVVCPTSQVCAGGECFDPGDLEPPEPPAVHDYVSPGGGGGCATSGDGGAGSLPWLLLLALVAVLRKREANR